MMTATKKEAGLNEIAQAAEMILRLARGTGDVTSQAVAAAATATAMATAEDKRGLTDRIEALLRAKPHSLAELMLEVDAPAGRVSTILGVMKRARRLSNVGAEDRPEWFWRVGDRGETPELRAAVERLLEHRPMSFAELIVATGARGNRISGVLNKILADRDVKRLGDARREIYSLAVAPTPGRSIKSARR